jgi:hypothetical protein
MPPAILGIVYKRLMCVCVCSEVHDVTRQTCKTATILVIVYKRLMCVCVVKSTMWPDKHVRQQQYLLSALQYAANSAWYRITCCTTDFVLTVLFRSCNYDTAEPWREIYISFLYYIDCCNNSSSSVKKASTKIWSVCIIHEIQFLKRCNKRYARNMCKRGGWASRV